MSAGTAEKLRQTLKSFKLTSLCGTIIYPYNNFSENHRTIKSMELSTELNREYHPIINEQDNGGDPVQMPRNISLVYSGRNDDPALIDPDTVSQISLILAARAEVAS